MDDDDVPEAGVAGETAATKPAASSDELVPSKPPRPQSETPTEVTILKEAFPSVEEPVVKAIIRASGGRVETAFNALLGTCHQKCRKHMIAELGPLTPAQK